MYYTHFPAYMRKHTYTHTRHKIPFHCCSFIYANKNRKKNRLQSNFSNEKKFT